MDDENPAPAPAPTATPTSAPEQQTSPTWGDLPPDRTDDPYSSYSPYVSPYVSDYSDPDSAASPSAGWDADGWRAGTSVTDARIAATAGQMVICVPVTAGLVETAQAARCLGRVAAVTARRQVYRAANRLAWEHPRLRGWAEHRFNRWLAAGLVWEWEHGAAAATPDLVAPASEAAWYAKVTSRAGATTTTVVPDRDGDLAPRPVFVRAAAERRDELERARTTATRRSVSW